MPQLIYEKRAGELFSVSLGMKNILGAETISSVTAVVDAGLTAEGVATFLGTTVYQPVSGGTAGAYYAVTFTVITGSGSHIIRPAFVRVIADVKPTALGASALVSLEDAKVAVSKTSDEDDALLEQVIGSVSAQFNAYTRRTLAKATYTSLGLDVPAPSTTPLIGLYDDDSLSAYHRLYLPNWPVTAVTSVYELGNLLVVTDDYLVYDSHLYRVGNYWAAGAKSVVVTFDAGYVCLTGTVTLPADIKYAALKQIGVEFTHYQRKDWDVDHITYPDGTMARSQSGLLKEVKAALDPYVRLA